MWRCAVSALTLLVLLGGSRRPWASEVILPGLEELLRNVQVVARVRILDSESWYYLENGERKRCGYTYRGHVLNELKGFGAREIRFASLSSDELVPGEEYLVLLYPKGTRGLQEILLRPGPLSASDREILCVSVGADLRVQVYPPTVSLIDRELRDTAGELWVAASEWNMMLSGGEVERRFVSRNGQDRLLLSWSGLSSKISAAFPAQKLE